MPSEFTRNVVGGLIIAGVTAGAITLGFALAGNLVIRAHLPALFRRSRLQLTVDKLHNDALTRRVGDHQMAGLRDEVNVVPLQ